MILMKNKLLLCAIICIVFVNVSGCIIPTYEDTEGNTHLGFPPSGNIDEKPDISIYDLEYEIHELVNTERVKQGLPSLAYDDALADIARDHSNDMATYNFFSHNNLNGQDPTDRAIAAGYPVYKDYGNGVYSEGIAENIYQNWLYDGLSYYNENEPIYKWSTQSEIASSTVNGWMNSPGHRANILDSSYDKEGIGVSITADYKVYVTQDFW